MGHSKESSLHRIGFNGFAGNKDRSKLFKRPRNPAIALSFLRDLWRCAHGSPSEASAAACQPRAERRYCNEKASVNGIRAMTSLDQVPVELY
jgi:hypothetical protein